MCKFKDLTNKTFGRLTVKSYSRKNGRAYWCCVCECGNIVEVRSDRLTTGETKSCGCLQKDNHYSKHGMTGTRLYEIWAGIKRRCYNKNYKRYKDYGQRGIKMCDEWKDDFMEFYKWAIDNGYNDTLTIDRVNNDKNYEPNNCKWSTPKQQVRNRRNTKCITYNQETKPLAEWCEIYQINYNVVYNRIYNCGWSIKKALTSEV